MSKLPTSRLLAILRSLLRDVEDMLGTEVEFTGDFDKITRSVKIHGASKILLLRFPRLCSDLERSLETGSMSFSEGLFVDQGRLTIFSGLLDRIFTKLGFVYEGSACPESIRHLRQILRFAKRYEVDCPPESTEEKILEFRNIELALPAPNYHWGSTDFPGRADYPSLCELGAKSANIDHSADEHGDAWAAGGVYRDLSAIQVIADRLCRSFRVHAESFEPKHGPGAVSEKYRSSKFEFPSWPERLDKVFPYAKWGTFNEMSIELEPRPEQDPPAKLIAVPKDFRGPRLIASEPISSQFIQQGIMNSIRKCLRTSPLRNSYDPLSQEHSRKLVLASSVDRSLSTIDLSSASDRLSCWLVERIFRTNPKFLEALNAARTPDVILPDGHVLQLKKFAAQGAAFTFPIQSLVYAVICIGVMYASEPDVSINELARRVRVYGDDIIIPSVYFERVSRALTACYLQVNDAKSFCHGFFRESCGMDGYEGTDVTPASVLTIYHARDPSTLESTVECSNNLFMKGYIRASAVLLDSVPYALRKNIPTIVPGSSKQFGVFSSSPNAKLKTRWCKHWHQLDCRVLVVESKVKRTKPFWKHSLYQWFCEKPQPDTNWVSGEVKSVKARLRLRWVPSYVLGSGYSHG